ncbi:MAG: radical SAM protein [Halobacteriovoraceae bacterium]|nr:radical SAM protein [Halobacteriovoraceae bacterium]
MYIKNYLLFLWEIILNNLGFHRVYKLNFVVTKDCNSRCQNCNIWQVKPANELSLKNIQKIANSYRDIRWLDITGGEPTLRKDMSEIVRCFYQANPNLLFVHFPTNGILPQKIEEQARRINRIGNFKLIITVSVDGPEKINDRLRGVPGNFSRSVETYKRLSGISGVAVYFGMTLFKSNYQTLEETFNSLKREIPKLRKKFFHLNIGQTSEHYYENLNSKDIDINMEIYQAIQKFRNSLTGNGRLLKIIPTPFDIIDEIYRTLSLKFIQTKKTPISCNALKSSVYLSEKGMVYPCSMWNHPLGNIKNYRYSLQEVLKSKKLKRGIKMIENKKCSHCWTPCEAYQSIIGNVGEVLKELSSR